MSAPDQRRLVSNGGVSAPDQRRLVSNGWGRLGKKGNCRAGCVLGSGRPCAPHFTAHGDEVLGTSYTFPGVIPPHSSRQVEVSWPSDECVGGGAIIDSIELQVRVGLITRTENIPLHQAFELAGPKHSIIRNCR